ncbi:Cystathionine gamma-synthase [Beauveria bassiana]|nr:Cystathionine gamma-synthase [Beauveria bassiana]
MPSLALGESIPPDTAHAVSVSLPTWESNIGYEEGASWVVSRMTTGYPRYACSRIKWGQVLTLATRRFFVHRSITELSHAIVSAYGREDQQAMLFSTPQAVERCLDFMRKRALEALAIQFQSISFELNLSEDTSPVLSGLASTIAAALFPADAFGLAKQYWQHTGDGVSSRRAEFFHDLLRAGIMVPSSSKNAIREITLKSSRGPKRYQRTNSVDETAAPNSEAVFATSNDTKESSRFLEERFGRNLDLSLAKRAKSAIRRRIAGSLVSENDLVEGAVLKLPLRSLRTRNLSESDIYLFPTGMNAIFNAHRALMAARGRLQSVSFGFPYVDTLKILEKFGPGCIFYGHGSSSDLNELEKRLEKGERLLALFCEFPGNPLLASPDLQRIRRLADIFDFAVVVDETIGTFANVNVLQSADIVVSSLTKIFSGDSNVMGGSAVLNPSSKYYRLLKSAMDTVVEDNYWPEDIIFMERNSRDFLNRVERVNANAEAICDILRGHSLVKDLFYPKFNPSRDLYERFRLPHGGYGGLLSVVFHHQVSAQAFYDAMDIAKGPSLGTNFTLCSPYALLAHYNELPWAAQFGVDPDLVRVSVGLEDKDILSETFCRALQAAENATKQIDEQRTEVQHWT